MFKVTRVFILLLFCAVAPSSWAAAIRAQVSSDADIYAQPNFSSKKIDRLKAGTVAIVRTEKRVGQGGMGVFYKIKTSDGKIGYITDSDLVVGKDGKIKVVTLPKPEPPKPKPPEPPPVPAQAEAKPTPPPPPPTPEPTPAAVSNERPLWGLTGAVVQYSEKLRGKTWSRSHIFMGVRRTAAKEDPKAWRSDIGAVFTAGAPRFLRDAGAFGDTSGFIFLGEYLFLKPLIVKDKFNVSGAAGPLLAYSSYSTEFEDGPYSRKSIRPGLTLDVNGSLKILGDKYLRMDLKLYIEQTFYFAQTLTFQIPL